MKLGLLVLPLLVVGYGELFGGESFDDSPASVVRLANGRYRESIVLVRHQPLIQEILRQNISFDWVGNITLGEYAFASNLSFINIPIAFSVRIGGRAIEDIRCRLAMERSVIVPFAYTSLSQGFLWKCRHPALVFFDASLSSVGGDVFRVLKSVDNERRSIVRFLSEADMASVEAQRRPPWEYWEYDDDNWGHVGVKLSLDQDRGITHFQIYGGQNVAKEFSVSHTAFAEGLLHRVPDISRIENIVFLEWAGRRLGAIVLAVGFDLVFYGNSFRNVQCILDLDMFSLYYVGLKNCSHPDLNLAPFYFNRQAAQKMIDVKTNLRVVPL